jgi:hypothetical protein
VHSRWQIFDIRPQKTLLTAKIVSNMISAMPIISTISSSIKCLVVTAAIKVSSKKA